MVQEVTKDDICNKCGGYRGLVFVMQNGKMIRLCVECELAKIKVDS